MRWLLLSTPFLLQGHDLSRPSARIDLPAELAEVSGLTDVDANTVACLQDEAATIYFIDLASGKIKQRQAFAGPGDMEGLTRVGREFYALRSDGLVYRLQQIAQHYSVADSFVLRLPYHNIEGLGYDERNQHVLVAPKDQLKGDPSVRDQRSVYAFDPVKQQLLPEPVLNFSVEWIVKQARARGIKLPMRTTPKGRQIPTLKLRMSSVAVDPRSDHYCILSAVDRALLVLDREGALVDLHFLNAGLLPKPEGITFLANGDMLISTEGKGTPPRLVRYAARP